MAIPILIITAVIAFSGLTYLGHLISKDAKLTLRKFITDAWEEHCRQSARLAMLRMGINPDKQTEMEKN